MKSLLRIGNAARRKTEKKKIRIEERISEHTHESERQM
jgi:hypothetical protein